MYDNSWNYFPGRLHSTREMLFFLEHRQHIQSVLEPIELANTIWGDICHPGIRADVQKWIEKPYEPTKALILEICSRNVYYYKDIPLNHYYVLKAPHLIAKYGLRLVELSDKEIEQDLVKILEAAKGLAVHIIPHLNLRSRALGTVIPKRDAFVQLLERLCATYKVPFWNIGAHIEQQEPGAYLEEYMADSVHWSRSYDAIKLFLSKI